MGPLIGIDLGTTFSSAAWMEGREPRLIPDELGCRLVPSVVRFFQREPPVVGEAARRARILDAEHTITGIKRLMGRRINEVFDLARRLPYKIVPGPSGYAMVLAYGTLYSPPAISALILDQLKRAAEQYLGEPVREAVITVPAYFGHAQRQATYEAGERAGLSVKRLVVEPCAAAMAWGLDRQEQMERLMVFDLGGGTLDVSIMEHGEKVEEVVATAGDGFLGGDSFDERIERWLIEELAGELGMEVVLESVVQQRLSDASEPARDTLRRSQDTGIPSPYLLLTTEVQQRLRDAAESAKIALSQVMETTIRLPYLVTVGGQPIHLERMLSRTLFEELCADLFDRLLPPCQQALERANSPVDRVLLIGGSTRIPRVREELRTLKVQLSSSINPDEAVALGAAIQAGVLMGRVRDTLLLDSTVATLGIEAIDGSVIPMIPACTTIPTLKRERFTTMLDQQDSVEIHIIQGEHRRASDNRSLGRLVLSDIPPAARGVTQINVSLDIDANGLCTAKAEELTTGRTATLCIGQRSR